MKNLGGGLVVVSLRLGLGVAGVDAIAMKQGVEQNERGDGQAIGLGVGLGMGEVSREEGRLLR